MPGCDQYRDATFAAVQLRMVACKSRTGERWRQVLSEAARITEKYLGSVDEDITDDVIAEMSAAKVLLFPRQGVMRVHCADARARHAVRPVGVLVDLLKAAT